MAKRQKRRHRPKKVLKIPDLEHSKHAVVNSLPERASQESYAHAIDEFINWYCSEPRLAFNRTVVLRYRFFLEQKNMGVQVRSNIITGAASIGSRPPRLRARVINRICDQVKPED